MDIPAQAYPAIGAISAAVIAGAISFVMSVLSKEQKTSEFRQAWIDALREDLSEFVARITTITSFLALKLKRGGNTEQLLTYIDEKHEDVCSIETMYARIRLRLNPDEHKTLIGKLQELYSVLTTSNAFDDKYVERLSDGAIAESQKVLKAEWRRVKRGEPVFLITKYVSLFIFLGATIVLVLHLNDYLSITWLSNK